MRVLMVVSWYPPMRGGIARYAEEAVARLREQGHEVEVAAPAPAAAEHILDVRKHGAGRRLAALARRSDRLVIQFQPETLGDPGAGRSTLARSLLRLAAGMRAAPSSELVVHEVDYGEGRLAPLLRALVRPIWLLANVITVHTERERQDFAKAFRIPLDRIRVVSQGEHLRRSMDEDRAAARAALGIPAELPLLLAIGFLHPKKGFDRAIRAFAQLPPNPARLYVVGSVWREDTVSPGEIAELRRLADQTPGVELREGYLEDEDFDRWIVASDALVLPYRWGWSSNVMERGLLYDRPVIMSRVGGMADQGQARPGTILVGDDTEIVDALTELVVKLTRERATETR